MAYDPEYYLQHKEKMKDQMRQWRERNKDYHQKYYNDVIKKNKQKIKTDRFILNEDTIKEISPIKIGKSPYGLNGQKRRQLLQLEKTRLRKEQFIKQLEAEKFTTGY